MTRRLLGKHSLSERRIIATAHCRLLFAACPKGAQPLRDTIKNLRQMAAPFCRNSRMVLRQKNPLLAERVNADLKF